MSKNDGGPAFPVPSAEDSAATLCAQGYGGMTLRDYFIAHAPAQEISEIMPSDLKGCAAYLGISVERYKYPDSYLEIVAKLRAQWADAMLAEREK